jgi:hypothetical protein
MSPTIIRERVSEVLLRSGTDLAIDQRDLENRLTAAASRDSAFSRAHDGVAIARWMPTAMLWLAWRIHPRIFQPRL